MKPSPDRVLYLSRVIAKKLKENDPGIRLGVMTATILPFAQNVYS